MEEIKGKINTAISYAKTIDEKARAQIARMCDYKFTRDSRIRIMPDVHAGAGCTIGTTMTVSDTIVPNLVGVDIGCGMEVIKLKNKFIEVQKLDKAVRARIPAGFNIRGRAHELADEIAEILDKAKKNESSNEELF